jgi:hypothetical protein
MAYLPDHTGKVDSLLEDSGKNRNLSHPHSTLLPLKGLFSHLTLKKRMAGAKRMTSNQPARESCTIP